MGVLTEVEHSTHAPGERVGAGKTGGHSVSMCVHVPEGVVGREAIREGDILCFRK